MKRSLSLVTLLASTLALAGSPAREVEAKPEPAKSPVVARAEDTVQKNLVRPLAMKENDRSRFSRARLPASARRIRVLDQQPRKDKKGEAFMAFAIDARHGYWDEDDELLKKNDGWQKDTIVGCLYTESGEIFVKRGSEMRPVGVLLGKKTKAAESHICSSDAPQVAQAQ